LHRRRVDDVATPVVRQSPQLPIVFVTRGERDAVMKVLSRRSPD
jgi:hypothetical protein